MKEVLVPCSEPSQCACALQPEDGANDGASVLETPLIGQLPESQQQYSSKRVFVSSLRQCECWVAHVGKHIRL